MIARTPPLQFISDRDRPPVRVEAKYRETGVQRFRGNAFIEALPELEPDRDALLARLENYPPAPTASTRQSSEIIRQMELCTLGDAVYPFPEYAKGALAITSMMRETYVARNPLTATDMQRRHAIATGEDDIPFPANWKSSATGYGIFGITGMGKTTFMDAFLLRYPEVIVHTCYQGSPLQAIQIVYIVLRIPHDATLKSLCISFFVEIDRLTGNNYAAKARSIRNIAMMVELMRTVATSVSLGIIFIDELQNLGAAKGANAEFTLNLFSNIIERLGISLVLLATPAIRKVWNLNVRNARKAITTGSMVLPPMERESPLWKDYCETRWEYTYTKRKSRLNATTRNAWHDVSAGDAGIATLAFYIAQRNAIGGTEVVTADSFHRAMATDMAILKPAVDALLSHDASKLEVFDDLVFQPDAQSLLDSVRGDPIGDECETEQDEFEELTPDPPASGRKS